MLHNFQWINSPLARCRRNKQFHKILNKSQNETYQKMVLISSTPGLILLVPALASSDKNHCFNEIIKMFCWKRARSFRLFYTRNVTLTKTKQHKSNLNKTENKTSRISNKWINTKHILYWCDYMLYILLYNCMYLGINTCTQMYWYLLQH